MPLRATLGHRASTSLVLVFCAVQVSLVVFLCARPIVTDDLWWSLGLGSRFARDGPWLSQDPLLFTAPGPPDPSAWAFHASLATLGEVCGFTGLRILHVALVASILVAAYRLFLRISNSTVFSLVALQALLALSTYRLCQLRAELVSILFTFLLVNLISRHNTRSPIRLACAGGLAAIWANSHASFPLAPFIVGLALVGNVGARFLTRPDLPTRSSHTTARYLELLLVVVGATFVNPLGPRAYLRPLRSGDSTPDLSIVADEWIGFSPFDWPSDGTQPSSLAWIFTWVSIVALGWATVRLLSKADGSASLQRRATAAHGSLIAIAWGTLPAIFMGIRFLWLASLAWLPILVSFARSKESKSPASPLVTVVPAAALSGLLLVGFVTIGDWTILAPGTPLTTAGYLEPYSTRKYHSHTIHFLSDSGVHGRAFTDYFVSGYVAFWTDGRVQTFINGSLNVPPDVASSFVRVVAAYRDGLSGTELALLDAHGVDLFVGLGLPILQNPRLPWRFTTSQLDLEPGWRPIFRSARSSVYMRKSTETREIRSVIDYYAREDVPFDPIIGFDAESVVRTNPRWAIEHGLIPSDFPRLVAISERGNAAERSTATRRLALVYAALGLYEKGAELARQIAHESSQDVSALRRWAWLCLRSERRSELREAVDRLQGLESLDVLSEIILRASLVYLQDGSHRHTRSTPLLTQEEASELTFGYVTAKPRPWPELTFQPGP